MSSSFPFLKFLIKILKSYINEVTNYAVNQAKWKSARNFCKDNLLEFKIITEDELGRPNGSRTGRVSRKSNK